MECHCAVSNAEKKNNLVINRQLFVLPESVVGSKPVVLVVGGKKMVRGKVGDIETQRTLPLCAQPHSHGQICLRVVEKNNNLCLPGSLRL